MRRFGARRCAREAQRVDRNARVVDSAVIVKVEALATEASNEGKGACLVGDEREPTAGKLVRDGEAPTAPASELEGLRMPSVGRAPREVDPTLRDIGDRFAARRTRLEAGRRTDAAGLIEDDATRTHRTTIASAATVGQSARTRIMTVHRARPLNVRKATVFTMASEREKGFEPSTSTLARWHSTTELLPQTATFIAATGRDVNRFTHLQSRRSRA